MYGLYDKKNLNIIVLKILWEHTDASHRLQQQEVQQLVKIEYGLEIDRRSVKNNVEALKDIFADSNIDISTDKGYCLIARDFDDSELRMLIDSVLFSKSISQVQAKELIKKLKHLSSKYFSAKVSHVSNLPDLQYASKKQQLLYNLDVINDAISGNRKITFIYNSYGTDFELHPKRENYIYKVNPYQMVAHNGKYYLICNFDQYDNLAHMRVDLMTDVCILEEKRKPKNKIPELENGFSLPRHMAEHVYMFAGESVSTTIRCEEGIMTELVDWFGKDFRIIKQEDGMITIRVVCNRRAMFFWALQYGICSEVLEPKDLRDEIRDAIENMNTKYKEK